jgi:putative tricarboxylic transport membrane protein
MVVFGLLGYLLRRFDFPLAPLVFAFILGPIFEFTFRQTMILSSHKIFFIFSRPIALVALSISILFLMFNLFDYFWKLREKVIESKSEED